MELFIAAIAALVLIGGFWYLGRRRKQLLDGGGQYSDILSGGAAEEPPQVLSRDSLLQRPTSYDPGAWDDGPDGEATPRPTPQSRPLPSRLPGLEPEDELPTYFDRDFLARRQAEKAAGQDPAEQ